MQSAKPSNCASALNIPFTACPSSFGLRRFVRWSESSCTVPSAAGLRLFLAVAVAVGSGVLDAAVSAVVSTLAPSTICCFINRWFSIARATIALKVGFNDGDVIGGGAAKTGFAGTGEFSFSGLLAGFSGFSVLPEWNFGFRLMQLHMTHIPNIRKNTKHTQIRDLLLVIGCTALGTCSQHMLASPLQPWR